jgi:hypothetical protein
METLPLVKPRITSAQDFSGPGVKSPAIPTMIRQKRAMALDISPEQSPVETLR